MTCTPSPRPPWSQWLMNLILREATAFMGKLLEGRRAAYTAVTCRAVKMQTAGSLRPARRWFVQKSSATGARHRDQDFGNFAARRTDRHALGVAAQRNRQRRGEADRLRPGFDVGRGGL